MEKELKEVERRLKILNDLIDGPTRPFIDLEIECAFYDYCIARHALKDKDGD